MKQAKEKVWATVDGKLVKDGDEKAAILVAAEGQLVPDEYVKEYSNGGSFFKDVTQPAPEPNIPAPKIEQFVPGQTNAPASAKAPQEKVSPVKTIGSGADPNKKPDGFNVEPTSISKGAEKPRVVDPVAQSKVPEPAKPKPAAKPAKKAAVKKAKK